MQNEIKRHAYYFFFSINIFLAACSNNIELSPFTSDGCSLFPDSSLISKRNWCECCFQHDLAYWRGGTKEEREIADSKLRECVHGKTGDEALAKVMYDGVRFGGSPYFYNWYRWGYGWSYQRKYQALTDDELKHVKKLEKEYLASSDTQYCDNY